jgi:GTP-binding protein HflX
MPLRVWLSAQTGEGLDALLGVITDYLHVDLLFGTVRLSVSQARLRALLYDSAAVIGERVLAEGGWELDVEIDRKGFQYLQQTEDLYFQTGNGTEQPVIAN